LSTDGSTNNLFKEINSSNNEINKNNNQQSNSDDIKSMICAMFKDLKELKQKEIL